MRELTDILIRELSRIPGLSIYGPLDSRRQTAIVSFNIDGIDCGK